MTASDTLLHIASLAKSLLRPRGRAVFVAETLREIASIPEVAELPLSLASARAGYEALSRPREDDLPIGPLAHRRMTCGELAALIPDGSDGDVSQLGAVLRVVAERYADPCGPDRQAAIREDAAREAEELEQYTPQMIEEIATMTSTPRTPKEAVYDEKISPLMSQIIALCKEHKINMVADFSLGYDPAAEQTLFCTTAMPKVDPSDEEGVQRMTRAYHALKPDSGLFAFTITSTEVTR